MKKTTLVLLFFISVISFAQTFKEKQLPEPTKMSPFEIGPLFKSSIYYGATPPNYNGKVILFTHGLGEFNQLYFALDNSFYEDAYNEGYQTAFVATTRGKGFWKNGELLAESIDIITNKYNVPTLFVVGHSDGGRAAEIALIEHNKNDKVERVFALGTPYWGTYIADFFMKPETKWMTKLIGITTSTEFSTTFYNRDVARPYLDNHPNNQPNKFVIIAGSSYKKDFKGKLSPFILTGKMIGKQQGTNDGIAPYSSTLRPGATYIFEENDPRAMVDHFSVGFGQFSWEYMKPYLEGKKPAVSRAASIATNTSNQSIIESDYYMIDDNSFSMVTLDKTSKEATLEVIHKKPNAAINYLGVNRSIDGSKIIDKDTHKTILSITDTKGEVKSDSEFIGFVKQHNNIRMTLEKIQPEDEEKTLKVGFKNVTSLDGIKVTATITKISDLKGEGIENSTEEYSFTKRNNHFYFTTTDFEEGIYSLEVNAEKDEDFKRTIVSGFAIGKLEYVDDSSSNDAVVRKPVTVYPNSFTNTASLKVEGFSTHVFKTLVGIYNSFGIPVRFFFIDTLDRSTDTYDISKHVASLKPGTYFLKVGVFKSIRIVKK